MGISRSAEVEGLGRGNLVSALLGGIGVCGPDYL
jgi:MFS superfamily sulfate permease-like transporter